MSVKELKTFGGDRFEQQSKARSLWQTLAQNFYPERADFTVSHSVGEELASGLSSSQPVLIRRELGNSFSAMLRDGQFFKMTTDDGKADYLSKKWLDFGSQRLFKLLNHRSANFRRATKEGDHDYATFGQNVLSVEPNKARSGLLYRSWNLRDCAWWDNDEGSVGGVVRKWNPKLHELKSYFGEDAMVPSVRQRMAKKPFDTLEVYHFDMPYEMYEGIMGEGDGELARFEWVSCFLDVVNGHIIRKVGKNFRSYIVPRFQTISGSPYAYSPATVVGLPDARTLQAMTHTLLEAGERSARPPIIATENVIRGDANLYADGVTFVSEDYDERLGASMRPLMQDASGFPFGMDMREGIVEVLQAAFYLNKINMPETGHEMTAYEVQERMKQFRRENLPLFAPMEHEYNGQMCELSFDIALEHGMLGSPHNIPPALRGREVIFKFESPLSESEEERKVQLYGQVADMLAQVAEIDPGVAQNIDFDEALRDSVEGIGTPTKWLRSVEDMMARREQQQAGEQMMAEQQVA